MECLVINKKEVLRYLGYQGQEITNRMAALIEECIDEIRTLIKPRSTYQHYQFLLESNKIYLNQTSIVLSGQDIVNHLAQAQSCIVMAVTLGTNIDTKIRYYEKTNLTKALVLDACASTAVEQVVDNLCDEINNKLKQQNQQLTSRYSPGYGDFPLEIQQDFISLLNANRKIGLHASQHSLLQPRKSVTAIAGVINANQAIYKHTCYDCALYRDCQLRKDNDGCGN